MSFYHSLCEGAIHAVIFTLIQTSLTNILRKLLSQLLCSSFNCLATASACIHFAPRVYEGSQ